MNNSRTGLPKTELINTMRKIIFPVRYKGANMNMSAWQTYTFPSGNMKIPCHFIQNQTAVNTASIMGPIWNSFPSRKFPKMSGKTTLPQQILCEKNKNCYPLLMVENHTLMA